MFPLADCPSDGCIQIGHDLGIWDFKDDLSDFLNIAQLKHRQNVQTFPERSLNNRAKAAADILNVFMHAKISCTTSTIGKFLPVAGIALYAGISPSSGNLYFTSHQVSSICVDDLGRSG